MEKEFEQVTIDFTNKAQKLFLSMFEKFRDSTKQLNRLQDENVFQQQQGKYVYTLKEQLEALARELLYKNKSLKNINHCNKILTDEINNYLNEFRKKSRSI